MVDELVAGQREALERCWAAQGAYIAGQRADFSEMAATLHPEIVIEQPRSLPYGGKWRGHAGLERWLVAMDAVWSAVEVLGPEIVEGDGTAIVSATFRGTPRHGGAPVEMPICEIVGFAEGLPTSWRVFYFDTAAVLAALCA